MTPYPVGKFWEDAGKEEGRREENEMTAEVERSEVGRMEADVRGTQIQGENRRYIKEEGEEVVSFQRLRIASALRIASLGAAVQLVLLIAQYLISNVM